MYTYSSSRKKLKNFGWNRYAGLSLTWWLVPTTNTITSTNITINYYYYYNYYTTSADYCTIIFWSAFHRRRSFIFRQTGFCFFSLHHIVVCHRRKMHTKKNQQVLLDPPTPVVYYFGDSTYFTTSNDVSGACQSPGLRVRNNCVCSYTFPVPRANPTFFPSDFLIFFFSSAADVITWTSLVFVLDRVVNVFGKLFETFWTRYVNTFAYSRISGEFSRVFRRK